MPKEVKMLNKETVSAIESKLNLKEGALAEAISKEEETGVELPELVIRTTEQETQFKNNLKAEHEKVGREIAVKVAKDKLGLSFEGKSMDDLLSAHEAKIVSETNANPDERVADLQSKIDTLNDEKKQLQTNLQTKITEYDNLKTDFDIKEKKRSNDNLILSHLSEDGLPKEDKLILFNSKYQIEALENGKIGFKQNGRELKDEQLNWLTAEKVVKEFDSSYVKRSSGGAGGGDDMGNHKEGTFEAFIKEMKSKNIGEGTPDFNTEMQKRINDGTLTI